MPPIVLEFYAKLSKDMEDPISPNIQRTVVWGHSFELSQNIINYYWECEDISKDEVEILETNPMVSVIM